MGFWFDYENEIQFQFQLEIVPSRKGAVNKLKIRTETGKVLRRLRATSEINLIAGRSR
jgi:hypothetical protein